MLSLVERSVLRVPVWNGPRDLTVEERADPVPGEGEIVVRVAATGICGSDVHGFTGENGRRHPGQIMGHETVGHVAAVGSGVEDRRVGDTVTVNRVLSCGRRAACRAGAEQSCPDKRVVGVDPALIGSFCYTAAGFRETAKSKVLVFPNGGS